MKVYTADQSALFATRAYRDGGATLVPSVYREADFTDGYLVSLAGHERQVTLPDCEVKSIVAIKNATIEYDRANRSKLNNGKTFVGLWIHEGILYLDVTERFTNREDAIQAGKDRNQLAIWDVANRTEITLGEVAEDEAA